MGYCTLLFIGERSGDESRISSDTEEVQLIAVIDVEKIGSHEGIGLTREGPQRYCIAPPGGDGELTHDEYGDVLSVGTRDAVLPALEARLAGIASGQRCYLAGVSSAVAVLRALTPDLYPALIVLGYGY